MGYGGLTMRAFGWGELKRRFVFSFVLVAILSAFGPGNSPAEAETYKIRILIIGRDRYIAQASEVCDDSKECTVRIGENFEANVRTEKLKSYDDPDFTKYYRIGIVGTDIDCCVTVKSSSGDVYIYEGEKTFHGDLYYDPPANFAAHITPKYGQLYIVLER